MAVYLFDEKRWYEEDSDAYAEFLQDSISDLIVLAYGSSRGGAIGWKSKFIDSMSGVSDTKLLEVIASMNKKGIRVHVAFNTCRTDPKSPFKSHKRGSQFVDVHSSAFQEYISNLMAECAVLPVDGICIDYCRTDDKRNVKKNNASIEAIVSSAYKKIKLINKNCVVSSTTTPYRDVTHPDLIKTGRKAIAWANAGYQDILFDMNYGNVKGVHGDPPDMYLVDQARKLTNVPVVVMVSSYKKNRKGAPVSTDAVLFAKVLDSVFAEDDIAIYTGWLFTEEQAALTRQMYDN